MSKGVVGTIRSLFRISFVWIGVVLVKFWVEFHTRRLDLLMRTVLVACAYCVLLLGSGGRQDDCSLRQGDL